MSPLLDPLSIVRGVVYCQAAFRRYVQMYPDEQEESTSVNSPLTAPTVAVALYMSRRLTHPEFVDIEGEAMGVVAIMCGHECGLTLGPLVAAYKEYTPYVEPDHPIFPLLAERFTEVAREAEEALLPKLEMVTKPSEARAILDEFCITWGAPLEAPGGAEYDLLDKANQIIGGLCRDMEEQLSQQMTKCQTRAGLEAISANIEFELAGVHTLLRERARKARWRHREHVEDLAHSEWGWPPIGDVPVLADAARWNAVELGMDHPVVADFVSSVRRQRTTLEKAAIKELEPLLQGLEQVRKLLYADPAPPSLLAEGYREDLEEQEMQAVKVIQSWKEKLGFESLTFLQYVKDIVGHEAFILQCNSDLESICQEIRKLEPRPPPHEEAADEVQEYLSAAVRLHLLLQIAQREGSQQAAMRAEEFSQVLQGVENLAKLLDPVPDEEEDDGWNQPLGYQNVDQPLAPPVEPPKEASSEETSPPTVEPEARPDIRVEMKIHGVSMEDARCKSEVLLLDTCAAIIAKECRIPQEWITHCAFKERQPEGLEPKALGDPLSFQVSPRPRI